MLNQSIAEDIKHTGGIIRDWISPFYTLGAFVTFAIGMLTLLDKDGTLHLTRYVGVALLIATFLAWAHHFYQQYHHKAAPVQDGENPEAPRVKPHIFLLMVSGFFVVGIFLSEALMHSHRQQLQAGPASSAPTPVAAPSSAPAETSNPAPTARAPDFAPSTQVVVPVQAAPAAAHTPPTQPAAPAAAASAPSVEKQKSTQPSPREDKKPRNTPETPNETQGRTQTKNPAPFAVDERCTELMAAFSLGQDLSPKQQNYLEKCR